MKAALTGEAGRGFVPLEDSDFLLQEKHLFVAFQVACQVPAPVGNASRSQ